MKIPTMTSDFMRWVTRSEVNTGKLAFVVSVVIEMFDLIVQCNIVRMP